MAQWLSEANTSGIKEMTHLVTSIEAIRDRIENTMTHGMTNALVESTNTRIRLLTRMAFGYHSPQPLIALAMLSQGKNRPRLPGRDPRT